MRDPFSLTMDALVSTQVQVVPSVARTVTSLPATESTVPRSNASVRAPFLVSKVNSPWIPPSSRSRTSARPSRRTAAALVAGVLAVGVASASTPFSTAAWPVGPLDSAVDAAGVRFGLDPETASVTANAPPATTAQATMTAASRPRPRPPCGGGLGCRGCRPCGGRPPYGGKFGCVACSGGVSPSPPFAYMFVTAMSIAIADKTRAGNRWENPRNFAQKR